jgi:hypothetical protein
MSPGQNERVERILRELDLEMSADIDLSSPRTLRSGNVVSLKTYCLKHLAGSDRGRKRGRGGIDLIILKMFSEGAHFVVKEVAS